MGKRRSMNRKKKYDDACSKNMIKTCDNSRGVASWSDLNHDVLLFIMMKIGPIDFVAFSGVCKSWRSLAISNRNMFMVSKPPMSLSISKYDEKKKCYLEDFEGRKFKTVLPHSDCWDCIGVTCGYLIFMGSDFWLVNLITKHELHFPGAPSELIMSFPKFFRAILVFSPSISRWVLVVLDKGDFKIWFCIEGKREWNEVYSSLRIYDVITFKGKIYTVHSIEDLSEEVMIFEEEVIIFEMRLYPEPKLVLPETMNIWKTGPSYMGLSPSYMGFVSCGENLYVINHIKEHPYHIHELDFGEMKWVSRKKTGEKHAFFRAGEDSTYEQCSYTLRKAWDDIHSQYRRYAVHDEDINGLLFHANHMWYFFDECLDVNFIHE